MANENDAPATKQDLTLLRSELRGEMSELRGEMSELRNQVARSHDDLVEKMRDMQTEVLRAFHGGARPLEIRMKVIPDIQERLGLGGEMERKQQKPI